MATALLLEFRSLGGVMAQTCAAQARVAGSASAEVLAAVGTLTRRWLRSCASATPILNDYNSLMDYLRVEHAHAPHEIVRALFLSGSNQLLRDEVVSEGSIREAFFSPRPVLRRALEIGAAAVILVHNHPSGDCMPSSQDQAVMRRFVTAAKALDIEVHDHFILSQTEHISFRKLGLI